MKDEDVRTTPMLEPGLHVVGTLSGSLRGASGDALAEQGSEGVLRPSGEVARTCRGRCADCGREPGMEESK